MEWVINTDRITVIVKIIVKSLLFNYFHDSCAGEKQRGSGRAANLIFKSNCRTLKRRAEGVREVANIPKPSSESRASQSRTSYNSFQNNVLR